MRKRMRVEKMKMRSIRRKTEIAKLKIRSDKTKV